MKMIRCYLLTLVLFPLANNAQEKTELYLGDGYKAIVTSPVNWRKGSGFGDESCYWKPGNEAGICIKVRSRSDRSIATILDEYISGMQTFDCVTKESATAVSKAFWKECNVKVGPRSEGRIWTVISYKNTRNVILVDVYLQAFNSEIQSELIRMLDNIVFTDPVKQ